MGVRQKPTRFGDSRVDIIYVQNGREGEGVMMTCTPCPRHWLGPLLRAKLGSLKGRTSPLAFSAQVVQFNTNKYWQLKM